MIAYLKNIDVINYMRATMFELVMNFSKISLHSHITTPSGEQWPLKSQSSTYVRFITYDRHETHAKSLFPALASRCEHRDAAICEFQSSLHFTSDSMRDRSQLPEPIIEHNAHYEHDIRYTMQLCRWVLKPIGIWHLIYGRASRNEKLISLALIVTCFSALCFVLIPSGLHTLFYEKDINIKVKLFGPVGFCLTSTIKYCYLGARGAAFGKCIRHVENDWWAVQYQDHRKMMLKNALVGRRLTMLCAIFLYTGGLSYHTILPLSSKQVSENVTHRPLTYPGYNLFFDPEASPVYEIVFCIHCLFALITYNITTAACSLAAIFVTHACGQLQILITLLDDLVEGKKDNNTIVEQRLGNLTRHHVRILKWVKNMKII